MRLITGQFPELVQIARLRSLVVPNSNDCQLSVWLSCSIQSFAKHVSCRSPISLICVGKDPQTKVLTPLSTFDFSEAHNSFNRFSLPRFWIKSLRRNGKQHGCNDHNKTHRIVLPSCNLLVLLKPLARSMSMLAPIQIWRAG